MLQNLFDDIPTDSLEEIVERIVDRKNVRIERIVSTGQRSPDGFWFDQPQDEFVVLLSGAAKLRIEDQSDLIVLKSGDFVEIPARQKHRVEWTSDREPTIWLAVHFSGE